MRQAHVDPGLLAGEELARWYRRTSDEIEGEREDARLRRFDDFFGGQTEKRSLDFRDDDVFGLSENDQGSRWREARVRVQPPTPVVRPGDARVGLPAYVPGGASAGPQGGFFDTYRAVPNPALGPAYVTDLPSPLNIVTPRYGGWYELGDGTLVKSAGEVERLHTEQQRRMRGEDEAEPSQTVRSADRYQDGFVPRADQLEKNQREEDATCHPYGGWERDAGFPTYSERTQRYETQITRAPGLDYVVRAPGRAPVKFDGCAVWSPEHELLEAKGPGYEDLVANGERWRFLPSVQEGIRSQAARQASAADGRPVEWHIAERGAVPFFTDALETFPLLQPRYTPAR